VQIAGGTGEPKKLFITTLDAPVQELRPGVRVQRRMGSELIEKKMFQTSPLLLIDGVRSTQEALGALDRTTIESIEVLKGRAVLDAFPQYTADEVAGGVITVKTKRAGTIK
jgi:outer membrane receptor protein involved in Fe transport